GAWDTTENERDATDMDGTLARHRRKARHGYGLAAGVPMAIAGLGNAAGSRRAVGDRGLYLSSRKPPSPSRLSDHAVAVAALPDRASIGDGSAIRIALAAYGPPVYRRNRRRHQKHEHRRSIRRRLAQVARSPRDPDITCRCSAVTLEPCANALCRRRRRD